MSWLKIDDRIYSHPALLAAGDEAVGLWVRTLAWVTQHRRKEGTVPIPVARHFGKQRQIDALLRVGLWIEWQGEYLVRDTLDIPPCGVQGAMWETERTDVRRAIPIELRSAIYERDNFACLECRATEDLTLDHIHPWSKGGRDTYDNLRTLCRPCNSRKGARV